MQFDKCLSHIFLLMSQLENATSPWGQSWERVLHKHSCIHHSTCAFGTRAVICMHLWAGMREGGLALPLAFQYLILMIWRLCGLTLVMISSLASKWQDFKVWMPVFQPFYEMKLKISKFKCWHFEASADIITNFKSQGLYTIRIKYWNASGSGPPPFLIPNLWNIGILQI